MSATLYDILGISPSASAEELKTAYKKLAKLYHPDKNQGSSWHEEQFKRVNQIYQLLSDPLKRKQYDNLLEYEAFQKRRPPQQSAPKSSTTNPRKPEAKKNTSNPYTTYKRNTTTQKKTKSLSDLKINYLVVSYYIVGFLMLCFYYEYQDYLKIQTLVEQAAEHEKNGRHDYAITSYSQALVLDRENAELYERRGMAKIKAASDLTGALNDFSAALKNTNHPADTLLFKRAKCLFLLKEYALAISDYETLLQNESTVADSSFFYKAECNFNLHNYSLSIPDYTAFLKATPNSGEAHFHRGICYYTNKNYNAALPDYNFSIAWQPENGEHYFHRGFINFALKDSLKGCIDFHDSFLLGYTESYEVKKMYCDKAL